MENKLNTIRNQYFIMDVSVNDCIDRIKPFVESINAKTQFLYQHLRSMSFTKGLSGKSDCLKNAKVRL